MPIEGLFPIILLVATFLCSLVAGFLLAFAIVVMPSIKQLNDREFIRAFQVIDGITVLCAVTEYSIIRDQSLRMERSGMKQSQNQQ